MDALVKQRLASDKSLKTYDDAFEEVVADSCESFLRDAALSEKAEQLYKKSPETANAFVKFFKKIIEKIKYYYSGIHPQSQEGRIVSEWKDSLNERLQLFIDGVNAAARNLSNKENSTNDGGVKYQNRTSNDDAIKTQLKENQELLAKESIVADVVTPQHFDNARKAKEWAVEYLKSSGYRVERQNFGTIVFTEKQINKALNYLNTNEEAAAFACLPRVLKRGLIISGHNNHKGRGFDTVTIAGAVKINGVRGNMAVVVKLEKGDNKYRMHRILMPDGSKFVFDDKTKTEPTPSKQRLFR